MKFRGLERSLPYILGGAFFLSLLIGLLSRKPVGTAFMRAFFSSLVFGALMLGGIFLLRRYIPEIESMVAQNREGMEPEGGEDERGRVVDYAVDEDLADGLKEDSSFAKGGAGGGDISLERSSFGRGPLERGTFEKGKIIEQGAGIANAQASVKLRGGVSREASREEGEVIDEALPSLDALFETEEEEKIPEETGVFMESREEKKLSGDYINIGDARIPNEPETLAKAVKRMMKKD